MSPGLSVSSVAWASSSAMTSAPRNDIILPSARQREQTEAKSLCASETCEDGIYKIVRFFHLQYAIELHREEIQPLFFLFFTEQLSARELFIDSIDRDQGWAS